MLRYAKFLALAPLVAVLLLPALRTEGAPATAYEEFDDVPRTHWAHADIQALRSLSVTQGVGDNMFGLGNSLTRAEFITFLSKLLDWEAEGGGDPWYAAFVDAGIKKGAIVGQASDFRPNDPITREEMAVMLVRSMGYDTLASQLDSLPQPFSDVDTNIGYISLAKDFGIIYGTAPGLFSPDQTATREQAAAMMVRLYNKLAQASSSYASAGWKRANAFYAISSSSQTSLISSLDQVSFGWSRIEWKDGVSLNFTSTNANEYHRPDGYEEVLGLAKSGGKKALLSVSVEGKTVTASGNPEVSGEMPLSAYLISRDQFRSHMVSLIAEAAIGYDGVVADFENMSGEKSKSDYVLFLRALKAALPAGSSYLAVTVQPPRAGGLAYFDGYDFKEIGEIADEVILMAHDYEAKSLTPEEMKTGFTVTPLSPINEVYYALSAVCDPDNGVADKSKVTLQISFSSCQWKTVDGEITNRTPFTPDLAAILSRISSGAQQHYSLKYENPFVTFLSEEGADNIVWYENKQSAEAKLRLASLMGVQGVSFWRLGLIPPDFAQSFSSKI
ncbi:MAG: S-layer homology domain-containing protein [Clostridiales bacterium]|jgi:spore germination protein YaaH|nr:S-layer homology domain-containing protein [Clostridiales bacterium]MDR2749156.1 S-layer homology domain-containing protein [Clostridiales bacterium]